MANQQAGKALSEIPALKPYWGKPAVRNFRGEGGNVGIIEARLAPLSYSTPAISVATPEAVFSACDTVVRNGLLVGMQCFQIARPPAPLSALLNGEGAAVAKFLSHLCDRTICVTEPSGPSSAPAGVHAKAVGPVPSARARVSVSFCVLF